LDRVFKQNVLVNIVLLAEHSPVSARTRSLMAFLLSDMTVILAVIARVVERRHSSSRAKLGM
jgi:apolipoprotein N-acyltransferase